MLSETDKAWMAGFLDGDGSIYIGRQVRKNRPSPAYRVYVLVSNTNREVIEFFRDAYGGRLYNVHERRKDKRGKKWADAWDWNCPQAQAHKILEDVLPYLKLKRPRAEVCLEFLRNKKAFARKRREGQQGGSAPLSEDEIAFRERLYWQSRELNSKGVYARSLSKGGDAK